MAKRFTDSKKWDKPWYKKLPAKYKCLWDFITSKCDLAGVWEIDFDGASYHIGEPVSERDAQRFFKDHIYIINPRKWFVVDFIKFQYGENPLNPKSPIHKKVLEILTKYSLSDTLYATLPARVKEEEEEKEGEEEGEQEEENGVTILSETDFEIFWDAYDKKTGDKKKLKVKWDKLTEKERVSALAYIPVYVAATPDKQYRKNPDTFLNNKSWNDEIIQRNETRNSGKPNASQLFTEALGHLKVFKNGNDATGS